MQFVVGAAHLERPGRLQVLQLHIHISTGKRTERFAVLECRLLDNASKYALCMNDVRIFRKFCHAAKVNLFKELFPYKPFSPGQPDHEHTITRFSKSSCF